MFVCFCCFSLSMRRNMNSYKSGRKDQTDVWPMCGRTSPGFLLLFFLKRTPGSSKSPCEVPPQWKGSSLLSPSFSGIGCFSLMCVIHYPGVLLLSHREVGGGGKKQFAFDCLFNTVFVLIFDSQCEQQFPAHVCLSVDVPHTKVLLRQ